MALTGDQILQRFVANEDRLDKFINTEAGYISSTGGTVPGLMTAPTTTAGITHTSIVSGVPQTLKGKVDQTVSLKDFGDAGAGDWAPILQDAFDKCIDAGVGTLELHGGVITVNSQVDITAVDVCSLNVIGPGIEECRVVSGVVGDTLNLDHAGYMLMIDGLRNSKFSGFTLDYSVSGDATSAGRGGIVCVCRVNSCYHNVFEELQLIGGSIMSHREATNRRGLKFVGNDALSGSTDYSTYFNAVRKCRFNYAHTHIFGVVGDGAGEGTINKQPNANFVSDGNLFERYIVAVDVGDCDEWEVSGDGMFFHAAAGKTQTQSGTLTTGSSVITLGWSCNPAIGAVVTLAGLVVPVADYTITDATTITLDTPVSENTAYTVMASDASLNDGYTDCVYSNGTSMRLRFSCEPGWGSRPFSLGSSADLVLHDINSNAYWNPNIPDSTKRIVGMNYRGFNGISEINRLQAKDLHIFGSATAGTSHSGSTAYLAKIYHKGGLAEYIGIGFDNSTGVARVQAVGKDIDLRPTSNKQNILTGGNWQSPVRFGDFRLWFTAGGALYKKSGSDPSSDTDGTAV